MYIDMNVGVYTLTIVEQTIAVFYTFIYGCLPFFLWPSCPGEWNSNESVPVCLHPPLALDKE